MDLTLPQWALVILLSPLVGFVIQIFAGRKLPRQGDWVPTLFMFGPLCISIWMVFSALLTGGVDGPGLAVAETWQPEWGKAWLFAGSSFQVDFAIHIDNLTIVMLFVVTLVSFLVHLYSMGYMKGEVRYNRFFAYLGLFSFSMLGLCITDNLLFVFIFWELVGLCSYFLIGFYFEKKSAQEASIKAFMTTRIGDLGFFLAILIIAGVGGSLRFTDIFEAVQQGADGPWHNEYIWGVSALVFAGVALLFGPIGKSAQFPLHVWLPDAMEGPTPVSALIHAATMVAAGVYLVGRMFPFLAGAEYFNGDFMSSTPLLIVACVGGFTAFFAATIAFAQTDIKKVLAYSTISQLGYMFLGLGVGSLSGGLFHLMTHAFFKALLFLGSGSVIHAVHSNEMDDMGGLRKKMPITYVTFLIGTLAIAGLPYLSGFYSKELVLTQAKVFMVSHDGSFWHALPFWLGTVTAGMTCFYMFRLFFRTFHGKPQNEKAYSHAHESPPSMTIPLCILAFLALFAGGNEFIGHSQHWFETRVTPEVLAPLTAGQTPNITHDTPVFKDAHHTVLITGVSVFFLALFASAMFFSPFAKLDAGKVMSIGPMRWLHRSLLNLWYWDKLMVGIAMWILHTFRILCGSVDKNYVDGFVNLWGKITQFLTSVVGSVDHYGVDGAVRGLGEGALRGGRALKKMQTGILQVYIYASILIFAVVLFVSVFVIWSRIG